MDTRLLTRTSIHSPVKGETPQNVVFLQDAAVFNPLPHKEGDDEIAGTVVMNVYHFNPLPHKEGDTTQPTKPEPDAISIRSPIKRETAISQSEHARFIISIRSPIKRETLQLCGQLSIQH